MKIKIIFTSLAFFGLAANAMDWPSSSSFSLNFQDTDPSREEAMNLDSNGQAEEAMREDEPTPLPSAIPQIVVPKKSSSNLNLHANAFVPGQGMAFFANPPAHAPEENFAYAQNYYSFMPKENDYELFNPQPYSNFQPQYYNSFKPQSLASLKFTRQEHVFLVESLKRGLLDTEHNLFATQKDLSYCLNVVEFMTKGWMLNHEQLEVAYAIATHIRHEKYFYLKAKDIFDIIISTPMCADSLKSKCYRGLAKIETRTNNSLDAIIQLMKKAISFNPQCPVNYLWLGNVPGITYNLKFENYQIAEKMIEWISDPILKGKRLIKLGVLLNKAGKQSDHIFLRALEALRMQVNYDLISRAVLDLVTARFNNDIHKSNSLQKALEFLGESERCPPNSHVNNKIACLLQKVRALLGVKADPKLLAELYNTLGIVGYTDELHATQASWHLEALALLGENGKPLLMAQTYIALGNAQYPDGRQNSKYYLLALKIVENTSHDDLVAQAYNGLGYAQYRDAKHPTQASWHIAALNRDLDQFPDIRCQAYNGLGNCQFVCRNLNIQGQIFDIQSNEEWFEMVLEIQGEHGNRLIKAVAYNCLGNAAGAYCNNEEAIKWFQKALEMTPWDSNIKAKITRCQSIIKKNSTKKVVQNKARK